MGLTRVTLEARWDASVKSSQKINRYKKRRNPKEPSTFREAIQHYGIDDWTHEVLESHTNIVSALLAEVRWIKNLDSHHKGWNCTPGGEIPPGVRLSEILEGIKLLSEDERKELNSLQTI